MKKNCLITGSSGYVGSRLIQALADRDIQLICTARRPTYIQHKLPQNAKAVQADFSDPSSLDSLFDACETAFFLMHSLGEKKGFEDKEASIARHFVEAAKKSAVKKIIYLGGLVSDEDADSAHMRSRLAVGNILRESGIPVLEFRASVILGPGSTSFELIRALVERLPIMITPKWVNVNAQPIFIHDVISYLVQAIDKDVQGSEIIEIGGKNVVSYKTIMNEYAKLRGLRRFMIPVPFLTPTLSSLWLGLVTPVYARVGRKLIDSITHESVVTKPEAARRYDVKPLDLKTALRHSLKQEDTTIYLSKWSDAVSSSRSDEDAYQRYGNRIVDVYRIPVPKHIEKPFEPIERIGGTQGWYYLNFLWMIRGAIDLLFGGIGLRRGKPEHRSLQIGDALDWWRVVKISAGKQLRLKAEMKLPGRAWLDFELVTKEDERYIQQTVIFDPLGLFGLLYWYTFLPIHIILFKGMLKHIIKAAR